MNLKVLFPSSVAVFAAISIAHAAEAIVAAAPEPADHVRVCDAFGAGYFYIPGTQTCLNVAGEIRHQITWNGSIAGSKWPSSSGSLFRLDFSARNDSDYGPIYSFARVEGAPDAAVSGGAATSNFLYAGIGGFEAGYYDSAWTRFFGYGGFSDDGGRYGLMTNAYAAYQGEAGALSYIGSVDDLQSSAGKTYGLNAAVKTTFGNVSGGFGIARDAAAASTALKGYISTEIDRLSLRLMGLYADKADNSYTQDIAGLTLLGAVKAGLTDDLYAAIDYSYSIMTRSSFVVVDIGWQAAEGFNLLASGSYDSATKAETAFLRFYRMF